MHLMRVFRRSSPRVVQRSRGDVEAAVNVLFQLITNANALLSVLQ